MSEVIINGVTYESIESIGCKGCAFDAHVVATKDCLAAKCELGGVGVIYVKKEMACHGDDEWDAKYETFERHYPLIKWAVVAGLLGLVWLVSM